MYIYNEKSTIEHLVTCIKELDKRICWVENENAILKDKLRSYEQIEGGDTLTHTSAILTSLTTKESGPSLPSGSASPPIVLSDDDAIEKIIGKCKDPFAEGSKSRTTPKKLKNFPLHDTIMFSKHADEVPISIIDEYMTPPATKSAFGCGGRSSRQKSAEEPPKKSAGIGSQSTRKKSLSKQLFNSGGIEIMLLLCWVFTLNQRDERKVVTWTLPPSFAADVLEGKLGHCGMAKRYLEAWLPHSEHLEYIFLPVYDESDSHWWLAVISFVDETVYYLDTYQAFGKCVHRRTHIWLLANCISKILPTGSGSARIGNTVPEIRDWPISTGSGVPECGNSMHSALYVMDWISMQQCFQPNVFGLLDENVARMSAVIKLLLSSANEVGAELKLRASEELRKLKGN
ncbi:hypothetical protein RIF29_21263 [Crotalaria pallida]|uniref:Ubiquitin-like protease family profile domain-containing protein n=1 Tax=Crotalaria pallida TaxID=3830 RepID=A0AAN9F2G4_CROPI